MSTTLDVLAEATPGVLVDIPAGWAAIIVAALGVGGTILTMVLAWLGGLNKRLRNLEHRDRLSWLYIRSLIAHAYLHAPGVPLPEPPDGWLEDSTK